MPAEMTTDPLGLDCLFTNGQRSRIAVPAGFRNETLATNLVTALIELIHPRGGVDAAGTVRHHMRSLAGMVSWFDERGFTGGVKDLTRSQVAEFLMSRKTAVERNCRQLLIAFGNEIEPLSPGVLEFVTGKTFHPKRRRNETPLAPYSEAEWGRLQPAWAIGALVGVAEGLGSRLHLGAPAAIASSNPAAGSSRTWDHV